MLDPRIYRMALLPVVLAVIVLAFSLSDQQGPLGTNLAPDAYNGQNAYATMNKLAGEYPNRRPGSTGDDALASQVAGVLRSYNFNVSTDVFKAKTADGNRTLENVVGVRAGMSNGSIVIVAHRDALHSPSTSDLSGTAVLLEMARVLSGESLQHTVVLASTTGSAGAAGAERLARTLPQPVDAVLVLGTSPGPASTARSWCRGPTGRVSRRRCCATRLPPRSPPRPALSAGSTGLGGQLAHLAFPISPTEQAPFGGAGEPAVLLSVSGRADPAGRRAGQPQPDHRAGADGAAVDHRARRRPDVSAPSSYLVFERQGRSRPGRSSCSC